MASKVQVKIDATKIRGAFVCTLKGRTETKECICIPKEVFYHGKDGAEYLDFVGYEDERQSYGRMYSLKQSLNKTEYDQLKASGEQIPFCGDIKALQNNAAPAPPVVPASAPVVEAVMDVQDAAIDDLPF